MNRVPTLLLLLPLACSTPSTPPEAEGRVVELFDGESLAGWRVLGDARYTADDGCILGEVDGGGQSFLVTEESYGDFVLELDVKNELPGNSGIQVRSHVRDDGRLYGYQIEIDPSERAWSGGLYDEARRGWLDSLEGDDVARAAFRSGEWNRYRIECRGAWIRAWVNGVPTADYLDALDMEGVIGLQVHSGSDTRVRWRDLRLTDLGTCTWRDANLAGESVSLPIEGEAGAARFVVSTNPGHPSSVQVEIDEAGERRGVARASSHEPKSEWSVLVAWQGDRVSVSLDGAKPDVESLEARGTGERRIVVTPGAGQRVESTATLAPSSR